MEMSRGEVEKEDHGKHQPVSAAACLQPGDADPKQPRKIGTTDDRPFEADARREPAIDETECNQSSSRARPELSSEAPGHQVRQDVMSHLRHDVGGIDVEQPVEQQVGKVEHPCLTFRDSGIAEPGTIIPERQLAFCEGIGQQRLLGHIVGVEISAHQPAAEPKRPPEDERQPDRDRQGEAQFAKSGCPIERRIA